MLKARVGYIWVQIFNVQVWLGLTLNPIKPVQVAALHIYTSDITLININNLWTF